jgi:predicted transcriptional regulator
MVQDDAMSVRVPRDVKRRLDELAERRAERQPGYRRSDAIREVILAGLSAVEDRRAG